MLSYLLCCVIMLICRCARSVYLFVIFHKRDLSIGGGEGASWVLLPVDIVNAVCLVVVPGLCEGNAKEGKEGERMEEEEGKCRVSKKNKNKKKRGGK